MTIYQTCCFEDSKYNGKLAGICGNMYALPSPTQPVPDYRAKLALNMQLLQPVESQLSEFIKDASSKPQSGVFDGKWNQSQVKHIHIDNSVIGQDLNSDFLYQFFLVCFLALIFCFGFFTFI